MISIAGNQLSEDEVRELLATDHPLVEEFRYVEKYASERAITFRIEIIARIGVEFIQQRDSGGRRIDPVKRVIIPEDNIGCGNRQLYLSSSGDRLLAENQTFFPNQEFNDLGIGSALYESQERLYRALDLDMISLLAVDVGRYVWAKQGFDCDMPGDLEDMAKGFLRFLERDEIEPPPSIDHLWDIACHDPEGMALDAYPVGKFWMLGHADCWSGHRYLNDPLSNKIAESSRAATKEKRKPKIHPYESPIAAAESEGEKP